MTARLINIARGSMHDGPGVRTVVYFKGCNLSCRWCHNPESQAFAPEMVFHESRCIGCGRCVAICPQRHVVRDGAHVYLRENCLLCGRCAEVCPNEALSLCGEEYTLERLMREIQKDSHYYAQSGGGVTFSGGECLLFPDFLAEILHMCRAEGIHTAVESALHVPYENIARVAPDVCLFLADVKHMDSAVHKSCTGEENGRILDNIRRLAADGSRDLLLRVPLIPGVNDGEENLRRTVEFAKNLPGGARKVELLKYNNLASSKYESIGRQAELFASGPQTNERMDALCARLNAQAGEQLVYYRK